MTIDHYSCRIEIPIQVIAKMNYILRANVIFKYKSLVEQHYREPVDSKFEDITVTVLNGLESDRDKGTDDEAGVYEPEVRPEHNETDCKNSVVLI